ncbi:MAG: cell division protein FtsW [Meiothermus sp.]
MDPILLLAQLMLMGFSLLGVGVAEPEHQGSHLLRLGVALLVTLVTCWISPRFLTRQARLLYLVALGFLIAVLLVGEGPAGVRRWFDLRLFNFQPSELMKVAMVIYLAAFFHQRGTDYPILGPVLAVGFAAGLVIIEPDFDTGLLILVLAAFMLIVIGVPWRRLLAIGASASLIAMTMLGLYLDRFGYVRERFEGWVATLSGKADITGAAYQVTQAQKVIVRAGPLGQGPGAALPHLPEGHNDMVFASVIWAGGWFAGLMVLLAFGLIFARGMQIAARTQGASSVMALGLTAYLTLQAANNIGVVLGFLPVSGSALPLVSYGGSSMFVAGLALGLLHALSREALRQGPGSKEAGA